MNHYKPKSDIKGNVRSEIDDRGYGYIYLSEELMHTYGPSQIPRMEQEVQWILSKQERHSMTPHSKLTSGQWSQQEITILRDLYRRNTPISEIATEIGRTAGAIHSMMSQLNMSRRKEIILSVDDWKEYLRVARGEVELKDTTRVKDRSTNAHRVNISRIQNVYYTHRKLYIRALLGEISFVELRDEIGRVPVNLHRAIVDSVRREMSITA